VAYWLVNEGHKDPKTKFTAVLTWHTVLLAHHTESQDQGMLQEGNEQPPKCWGSLSYTWGTRASQSKMTPFDRMRTLVWYLRYHSELGASGCH
jgi:hypothetical protein